MGAPMSVQTQVEEEEAGVRLDQFLARRFEDMSRAEARRMIRDGQVRLNGRRTKKGTRVEAGDDVELERLPSPRDFEVTPNPELGLVVAHESAGWVAIDKPAGQPSHPLRADERDTLANALVARYPETQGVGYAKREPGIVHRLDNDTSGLLLAARDSESFERLKAALLDGAIEKRYLALVHGALGPRDAIEMPIASHPTDPRRVHACIDALDRRLPAARPARTEVLEVTPVGEDTLVEVQASVARRHQIRAHLAAIGHPLVGDWLYGGDAERLGRHFLHASYLAVPRRSGEVVEVRSELPPELASLL